jgi:clan AA aspartic protease
MIQGRFGDEDELVFEIELITADGLEFSVDAILDTGFSDWIAIDEQDLEEFNWEYTGERDMRLAKGETKFDVYVGKVRLDGQEFEIPVYAGKGVSEVLLGRQWLKNRRLVVDIRSEILTLEA